MKFGLMDLQPYSIGEMIRVGNNEDGGYVIPNNFRNSNLNLISIGLGDNWTFESQGLKLFFRSFLIVDHTVSALGIFKRILKRLSERNLTIKNFIYLSKVLLHYTIYFRILGKNHIKKKLVPAKTNSREITIKELMQTSKNLHCMLKMDIEGDEYQMIDSICREANLIDLLIIEFHETDKKRKNFEVAIKNLKNYYLIVHAHGNNYSFTSNDGIPNTLELTFVNKNQFNGNYPSINHFPLKGLDFPCNPNKPEIQMDFVSGTTE